MCLQTGMHRANEMRGKIPKTFKMKSNQVKRKEKEGNLGVLPTFTDQCLTSLRKRKEQETREPKSR
jgi:hypothetical protein